MSLLRLTTSCVLILLISACASIPTSKPIAPKVTVASVVPKNLSLSGTRLLFTLDVANPNSYDLPMEQLEFVASFDNENIARGASEKAVTIPANGQEQVEVVVVAKLSKFFGQLRSMLATQDFSLDYTVSGFVKLANWPLKIPFDVAGELEEPSLPLSTN